MKYLLPVSFILLLTSCVSPYNISKLTPDEYATWAWGRQFVHKTADSVVVKIAYETNDRHNVVFNVEVENNSSHPVLVAPEKFWSRMSGVNLPKYILQQQQAVDPESFYLELAKERSRQSAEATNMAISHATSSLAEIASDLTAKNETPEEKEARNYAREEAKYNRETDRNNLEQRRTLMNERKRFLDQTILRKTTLLPNSTIYGEVYFQRHDRATNYEIFIPINDKLLKFNFSQQLVQP